MNIGGGEAADQLVRMMLSGGEVAVRLGGSAAKNLLAMSLALAKSHRKISGRVRMGKMLQQTRDLRVFPMTQEEYRKAAIDAVKQLSKDVGIPEKVSEVGVKEEDIQFLAESAMADACTGGNPKDTSVEDIAALYRSMM